ncbi:ATP synthase F1 subunit delta [bacterium TMED277]|nr:MAG: ATP synthase F1 subunit delta [bacterium TMED277]
MQELNEISSKPSARYALALFELSKENKKLSEIEKEVDVFKGILTDENELNYFFRNPIYVTSDYEKVFLKVCEKLKFSNEFKNTVLLMINKGRSYDLINFTKDFLKLCSINKNELTVDIRTAKKVSKQNMEDIIKVVQQVTKKSIKMNTEVDPSIIAGMEMKIGSVLLDSSINSKLRNLKNSLKRGL